jgi:hypothetical protein
MHRNNILAACGATVASVLLWTGAASAAGPAVTVRVEGLKRTLLAPTVVHLHAGSVTKGGAPAGACPARSAAGALDAAARHHWAGTWSASFDDYEVTSILGETHRFSANKPYWSVWVGNKYASSGVCETTLHRGEKLLFAVEGAGTKGLVAIEAPGAATVGQPFAVTVVWFNPGGRSKPLAGATVSGAGATSQTDSQGTVELTPSQAGTLTLKAAHAGYVRSAPVQVSVTG